MQSPSIVRPATFLCAVAVAGCATQLVAPSEPAVAVPQQLRPDAAEKHACVTGARGVQIYAAKPPQTVRWPAIAHARWLQVQQ